MNRALTTIISLIIFIWPAILAVNLARAEDTQVNFTPQVSIPGSEFQSQQDILVKNDTSLICDYIIAIYKYAIAIVGIIAVLAIAIGGVMWITAAGNSGRIGEGKEWIMSGLLGLLLALGSFMILATINKDLVTCKITTLPKIGYRASGTYYQPESQKAGTVTESLDHSGQYKCCVIEGKPFAFNYPVFPLDMVCSGSTSQKSTNECPDTGTIVWYGIKRCATYESANTAPAQTECNNFYAGFNCYDSDKGKACYFKPQESNSGGLWSATIYGGKCWENPSTKDWCKGQ